MSHKCTFCVRSTPLSATTSSIETIVSHPAVQSDGLTWIASEWRPRVIVFMEPFDAEWWDDTESMENVRISPWYGTSIIWVETIYLRLTIKKFRALTERRCQQHSTPPKTDVLRYSRSSRVSQSLCFPLPSELAIFCIVRVLMEMSLR
jgi:hypothetical protein